VKIIFVILFPFLLTACNQKSGDIKKMQATIDSLKKQLAETYKPGFGEFMSGIQTHHAKLWFAGLNQNWALAEFEMHEIEETLDAVQKYCPDRPEIKQMGMMNPAIDTINNAIQQKNIQLFKSSFILLTSTCNNCHKATGHGFNVVTVPTNLPVVNQEFKPAQ
jgi:soluble cytochrome b562